MDGGIVSVVLYGHPACLDHDPGSGHPESPNRLRAVLQALDAARFAGLTRIEAPRANREQLARVHSVDLIASILDQAPHAGLRPLDADTLLSAGSAEAALRAAGAVCAAVDHVLAGTDRRAFCAVRPPGHHATGSEAMGFCLFNNIAVGAAHALAAHGLERVAIVDFDVPHGNGTQDIFEREPRVLFASTHQWPLYPGSGARSETGVGNIVNVPLAAGSGSDEFRDACQTHVLPALQRFEPQLLMISAGFDAHRRDPLASLALESGDYAWITAELVRIAVQHAQGRIVSSLEGGYDLTALAEATTAHVGALLAGES